MNNTIKFSVDNKNSAKRLDVFLTEKLKKFTYQNYIKLKNLYEETEQDLETRSFSS